MILQTGPSAFPNWPGWSWEGLQLDLVDFAIWPGCSHDYQIGSGLWPEDPVPPPSPQGSATVPLA
eukprot:10392873-Karenia_brevis.AAC.1